MTSNYFLMCIYIVFPRVVFIVMLSSVWLGFLLILCALLSFVFLPKLSDGWLFKLLTSPVTLLSVFDLDLMQSLVCANKINYFLHLATGCTILSKVYISLQQLSVSKRQDILHTQSCVFFLVDLLFYHSSCSGCCT